MTTATYERPDLIYEPPGFAVSPDDTSWHYTISDPLELVIAHRHEFPGRPGGSKVSSSLSGTGPEIDVVSYPCRQGRLYFGFGRTVRFLRYNLDSSTAILIDDKVEPEPEFGREYQQVIDDLRNKGREILAGDLIEILQSVEEDPDAPEIKMFSLRAMARFLIKHREFDAPIIGPDPMGIMQVEWHIIGDGLLVMVFVDDDCIHCVAQADATDCSDALNRSVQLTESQAIEEFRHLVPLC